MNLVICALIILLRRKQVLDIEYVNTDSQKRSKVEYIDGNTLQQIMVKLSKLQICPAYIKHIIDINKYKWFAKLCIVFGATLVEFM